MQVEKVSISANSSVHKGQAHCTNHIRHLGTFTKDSATFGHGIIMPDTQKAINELLVRLRKNRRALSIKDIALGEINAAVDKKVGHNVWDLVLNSSRGKGENKQIHTYYYKNEGNKIAKQERIGNSTHFIEEDKLDETGKLEWNNSVQQLSAALFRHLAL